MKNRIYILAIALLSALSTLSASDITSDGSRKLYFNTAPEWTSFWNSAGATFSAYFKKDASEAWADKATQVNGNLYVVSIPAGTWDHVVLTRHNPDFSTKWNESVEIELNDNNCVWNFRQAGATEPDKWQWCSYMTFTGKERLYFNGKSTWAKSDLAGSDWNSASAKLSACFVCQSTGAWAAEAVNVDGDIYSITPPAGSFTHVILTRHAPSTTVFNFDGNLWNQTYDIPLDIYNNYLHEFRVKGHSGDQWKWWRYSEQPAAGVTPSTLASGLGIDIDAVSVCKSATGDPLSLFPRIKADGSGYNYDNVKCATWFKTTDNGATWTHVTGTPLARESAEESVCTTEKVGIANSETYYYLYSRIPAGNRILKVSVDKDCDVECEITSFEMTPTAVNVGTNTYTMDGIVAFTVASGDLVIECDGLSTTIPAPESPQTFSLAGLTADGATDNFHAYFTMGSCETVKSVTAPVPAADATVHPDISKTPLDAVTLTPTTADGSDEWEWKFSDGTIVKNSPSANNKWEVPTLDHDGEVTYVYTEYNPLPTLPTNLMDNGSFEDVSYPYQWRTDYKNSNELNGNQIWQGAVKDIYDITTEDTSDPSLREWIDGAWHYYIFKNKYGFYGVADNTNTYWRLMANVAPKDGSYLAIIDGDETADRRAWHASTANNPNLKLMRGTTYLFSFWVANVNNIGELVNDGKKNCAILQFHIRCHNTEDGNWYEADLGTPIDLNDAKYMDYNWHQNSSTFSTRAYFGKDFEADNVTISVVDKNSTGLTIGNDFALDDIQFRAVSVVSKSVKAREFFTVKYYETPTTVEKPVITITQTPACGKTDFTMQVHVSYSTLNNKFPITLQLTDDVYGDIFATPITIDPAVNPDDITLTLPTSTYAMLVADGKVHTLTAKITRLDGVGVDKGGSNSATYTAPGVPAIKTPVLTELLKSCDKTTYDLKVETDYRAFKGTALHYEWDGVEWTNATNQTINYKEDAYQTATDTLHSIPADGQTHKLRIYSDNGLDCEYTVNPVTAYYMPNIKSVTTEVLHGNYSCGDPNYQVKVKAEFENGQGHNIIFKDWNGGAEQSVTTATTDTEAEYTFTYAWDAAPTLHTYDVYFAGATDCHHPVSYTSPAEPELAATHTPLFATCDGTDRYDLKLDLTFTNQKGTKFYASVDGGTAQEIANTHIAAQTEQTDLSITIPNLLADGKSHNYSVWTDHTQDCSLTTIPFTAPYKPIISDVSTTVQPYACGDGNYQVKVDVSYSNNQYKDLIITDDAGHTKTLTALDAEYAVSAGKASWTFDMPWEFPVTTHTFKAYFAGAEGPSSCKESQKDSYTAPAEPKIDNVNYTIVPATACDVSTYDLEVTFDYYNQDGTLTVDVDGVAATSITPAFDADSNDKQPTTAIITGLPADGGTGHVLTVKTASGSHNCTATTTLLSVPLIARVNSTTAAIVTTPDCNKKNYDVEITVDYTNPNGSLVITDGVNTHTFAPAELTVNPISHTFTGLTTTGSAAKDFRAYFTSAPACDGAAHHAIFAEPTRPVIGTITANPSTPVCDVTTYSVSGTVSYEFPAGDMVITDIESGKTQTIPAADLASPQPYTLTAIPADGKTHNISVRFTGDASCPAITKSYDAPHSPAINSLSHSAPTYGCGSTPFQTILSVKYTNGQGKKVYIKEGATELAQFTSAADADTHTEPVTLNLDFDAAHNLNVFFEGLESDCPHPENIAKVDKPLLGTINTNYLTACDQTTFDLEVDVQNFVNQDGTLTVNIDGKTVTSTDFDADSATPQNKKLTVTGLNADGNNTTHILSVAFVGGAHGCANTPAALTDVPLISKVNSTTAAIVAGSQVCNSKLYDVTISVDYTNPNGSLVITDGVNTHTFAPAELTVNPISHTFTGLTSTGNTAKDFRAYFTSAPLCDGAAHHAIFAEPTRPVIGTITALPTAPACDAITYNISGVVNYEFPAGDMVITDIESGKTQTILAADLVNPQPYTLTAIPADGKTHNISVRFTGDDIACPAINQGYTAPHSPAINTLSQSAPTYGCGLTQFSTVLTVNYTNGQGKKVYIKEGATELAQFTTEANALPHSKDVNLNLDLGAAHNLNVFFEGLESDCPHPITIASPVAPAVNEVTPAIVSTACNSATYDLQVTLKFVNQDGVLAVDVDGTAADPATLAFTPDLATEQTVVAVVRNLPADGQLHTLNVAFTGGSHSCPIAPQTVSAPLQPVLGSVTPSAPTYGRDDTQYKVTLSISYTNGLGEKVFIKEGATELAQFTAVNDAAPHSKSVTLDLDFDAAHNIDVFFEGKESCKQPVSLPLIAKPQLTAAVASAPAFDCSTTSVAPTINVSYTNQDGKPVVKWQHQTTAIDIPTTAYTVNNSTELTMNGLQLPALVPDGKSYTIEVSFDGSHGSSTKVPFTMPFIPQITSVSSPDPTVPFGETKYDVTVTVNFENGQGKDITIRSTDLTPQLVHSEPAPSSGVLTHTFTGIETDNGVTHHFEVLFPDASVSCPAPTTQFKSPIAKNFKSLTAAATAVNCNTEFTIRLTGEFAALGGNLVVNDLTLDEEIYNAAAPAGTTFDVTSKTLTADGLTHNLEAYFTSDAAHKLPVTVDAPKKPSLDIANTFSTVDCNGQVTAQLSVTFTNQTGDLVLLDENDNLLTTFTAPTEGTPYTYDWTMAADGAAHTAKAYFTSLGATCATPLPLTAPLTPTVTVTKDATLSTLSCDGTFSYVYDIVGNNQTGNLMVQGAGELTPTNYGPVATAKHTVKGVQQTAVAGMEVIRAWYDDRATCLANATETFPEAVSIALKSTKSDLHCDGTFDITLTVDFSGQRGDLVIEDANGNEIDRQTAPVSPYSVVWSGLKADGSNYSAKAYFAGATDCDDNTAQTAPVQMYINDLSTTESTIYCNGTTFDLTINVEAENPQADIIVKEGTTKLHRFTVATPLTGKIPYSIVLSDIPTDQAAHTIRAFFDGYEDCAKTWTYTAPTPNPCQYRYDTICVGQGYNRYGLVLPAQAVAGDQTHQVVDTIIELHVIDQPQMSLTAVAPVCNSEGKVEIPYSIVVGEPNRFDVDFDDAALPDLTGLVLKGGRLSVALPAGLAAGKYSATIEFYHSCASATCSIPERFTFEVSEDNLIYSKWTDVLLINNGDDRFTSYQWYQNGVKMDGETLQRLYDPEGLSGNYYCELTTVSGETIKTCVVSFGDVPRSADLKQPALITPQILRSGDMLTVERGQDSPASIVLYNANGKRVMESTLSNAREQVQISTESGLYVVVVSDEQGQTTEKIIVK